jgi:predicted acylesterase/phospholipase RssA
MPEPRKKIGLTLGGGSARGWSHVGVLRALEERGVRPDVVCGTSAGAGEGVVRGGPQERGRGERRARPVSLRPSPQNTELQRLQ